MEHVEFNPLPEIPQCVSMIGTSHLSRQATAHLLSGGEQTGELLGLSGQEQCAILMGVDDIAVRIPFHNLRILEFKQRFKLAEQSAGGAIPLKTFQTDYTDGKSLAGRLCAHEKDACGLHLFVLHVDRLVKRVFIPNVQVSGFTLGVPATEKPPQAPAAKIADPAFQIRTPQELVGFLDKQTQYAAHHLQYYDHHRIGELLVESGLISADTLARALEQQKIEKWKKLGAILEGMGAVSSKDVHLKLAQKFGIPYVVLKDFEIDHYLLNVVPGQMACKYMMLPLAQYRDRIVVTVEDPTNVEAIGMLRFISGKQIEIAVSSREEIELALDKYYGSDARLVDELNVAEEQRAKFSDDEIVDIQEAMRLASEMPIVRLVNGIIIDAIRKKASDIHIRPLEHEVHMLYRIDGTLIKIRSFSRSLLPAVVSRIKILGRMDITERRLPQDGRTRISDRDGLVDLRISVIPTINGESVVLRLLNTKVGLREISQLGFSETDEEIFRDLLHMNYGMLLVTGPTGSGKTTTLYAALQEVITQNVNIITVEDPVEYQIDGIEQIHVRANLGYTFAESLRHILRHDPDVIMVGEIRDGETAKIAVESALTGHLVLTTLHTNSAAGTITRLLEMGVEPYLVSSTVIGVLAQRLVRKNCPQCLEVEPVNRTMRRSLNVPEDAVFYRGRGCDQCHHIGYSGRMAVYELLTMSSELRTLIEQRASTETIYKKAIENGMVSLTQNALRRAYTKETSLEEVYRVRLG
ncbi:MAG: GspE/PulE family protein [Pseudomonadota bacterium]